MATSLDGTGRAETAHNIKHVRDVILHHYKQFVAERDEINTWFRTCAATATYTERLNKYQRLQSLNYLLNTFFT